MVPQVIYINGKFFAQSVTGVQRFARQTLFAVDELLASGEWRTPSPLVLLVPQDRAIDLPRFRCIKIRELPAGNLHAWEQFRLPFASRGAPLLSLSGSAPLFKTRQICTFHDAAVFDVPGAYSGLFGAWYRLLFQVQGHLSRRLLTVSRFSRERLSHHLGVSIDRIGIVPGAADHMRQLGDEPDVLRRLGVAPGGYFLAVGSATPTKNFGRLAEAFAGLPDADMRLVVVGGANPAVFADTTDSVQDDHRIVRAGRLSDEALKTLYSQARAYVFPSTYEGFGLPPVEAMHCGAPVIAARAASIPEVCGDAAGYFDPLSLDDIRASLYRAWHDDEWLATLRAAGGHQAELFTWRNSALALMTELAQLGLADARTATTPP
jgi:glycosyltransferase involved in cell wall biosynthesis